uniref:Peroxisomal leader peptide-processing protease n=1 Tax=Ficedula albicollis TaxID=59894 RepID=U3KDI4_FICAL
MCGVRGIGEGSEPGAAGLRLPVRRPVPRALPQHAEPRRGQQPGGRGERPGAHRRPLPARHRGRRRLRALAAGAARGGRDRRLALLEGRRVGRAHAALLAGRHPAQQRRGAGRSRDRGAAGARLGGRSGGQDPLGWTALVECGATWGSGVLLAPRMLLTCRHVVEAGTPLHVTPAAGPGQDAAALRGRVVFATEESSPFDVAVVELEESVPGFVPPCLADTFLPGEEVSVVGFGALGRACGPSVTAGVLSAVVAVAGRPVMLQTTCAVHGGSSGGPLVSSRSGCLMGIVASNTRDTGAGATYPHLNFCIPISVLQPLVARYRRTGDPDAFAGLNRVGEGVRATWQLQQRPGPPSKL